MAREAGLEPLADWIWKLGHGELVSETTLEVKAKDFLNPAKDFVTYEMVLKGAQDILVERIFNNPELRDIVRRNFFERGRVISKRTKEFKPHSKFEMYAEFSEAVRSLHETKASHRYLAMRRGWEQGELTVSIAGDDEMLLQRFEAFALNQPDSQAADFLRNSAKTALQVHVHPSISNEVHKWLKDKADRDAIQVFAENVRQILLASPFGAKCVLGVDPGLRTGCKVALLDKQGNFISHTVVQLLGEGAEEKAKALFADVIKQIKIESVAVGNGTGGREAEKFFRKIFKDLGANVPVVLVSETGASVYSASDLAREEFPELDITVRGAISIARRLQDPLSELVKVDPKSIGVGQYQHDVSQTHLKKSLEEVVESCVNFVGVDVNTASVPLLSFVAGIGPALAKNIVDHRKAAGLFEERDQLLKVARFSSKTFEQCAGFLRVSNSKVALDSTGIHPERYSAVRDMAAELGMNVSQLMGEGAKRLLELRTKWAALIGEYTFDDIVRELEKPGRDPRDPYKVFAFRDDIFEVKDLQDGMICPGVVTNVTNFGAFVDVGVHQDGLVHISELSYQFVDDPRKVVSPGDQVTVKVIAVDKDKNQISLSMLLEPRPKEARPQQPRAAAPRPERGPREPRPPRERRPRREGGEGRENREGGARDERHPARDAGRRAPHEDGQRSERPARDGERPPREVGRPDGRRQRPEKEVHKATGAKPLGWRPSPNERMKAQLNRPKKPATKSEGVEAEGAAPIEATPQTAGGGQQRPAQPPREHRGGQGRPNTGSRPPSQSGGGGKSPFNNPFAALLNNDQNKKG